MERKAVAWMPPTSRTKLADVLAIWHPPGKLTTDDYRGLLAIRFQNLIDRQPNPQAAADDVTEILMRAGLHPDPSPMTPADEAGSILIYSNLALPAALAMMGVEPGPYQIVKGSPAAELALQRDRQNGARPQEIAMRLVNALRATQSQTTSA